MATCEGEQSGLVFQTEVNSSAGFFLRWVEELKRMTARERMKFVVYGTAVALALASLTSCVPEVMQVGQATPDDQPRDVPTVVWTPTVPVQQEIKPTETVVPKVETPTLKKPEPTETQTTEERKMSLRTEAIRKMVGDKAENWFSWRQDLEAMEGNLIYTGDQSLSNEQFELTDGYGNVVGKAWQSITTEYLIGDKPNTVVVPTIWENYATGKCWYWNGPLECGGSDMQYQLDHNYLTNPVLTFDFKPGMVFKFFVDDPNSPGIIGDMIKAYPSREEVNYFYAGKEQVSNDFFAKGDPKIKVLLLNMPQQNCKYGVGDERFNLICRDNDNTVIIPGY
jgi:hypothetical protein